MWTMLLAPEREGYPSAGLEGRLGAAGRDHEVKDLMRGLWRPQIMTGLIVMI